MAVGVLGFIGLTEEYSKAVGYSRNLGRGGVMKQGSTCEAGIYMFCAAGSYAPHALYIYIYPKSCKPSN